MNNRKNKELKNIWFEKGEYKKLVESIDQNNTQEVLDIIFNIYARNDL